MAACVDGELFQVAFCLPRLALGRRGAPKIRPAGRSCKREGDARGFVGTSGQAAYRCPCYLHLWCLCKVCNGWRRRPPSCRDSVAPHTREVESTYAMPSQTSGGAHRKTLVRCIDVRRLGRAVRSKGGASRTADGRSFRTAGQGANAFAYGTMSTGHGDERTTRSDTLPSSARAAPVRPWVPMMMRSTLSRSATSLMTLRASPSTSSTWVATPC